MWKSHLSFSWGPKPNLEYQQSLDWFRLVEVTKFNAWDRLPEKYQCTDNQTNMRVLLAYNNWVDLDKCAQLCTSIPHQTPKVHWTKTLLHRVQLTMNLSKPYSTITNHDDMLWWQLTLLTSRMDLRVRGLTTWTAGHKSMCIARSQYHGSEYLNHFHNFFKDMFLSVSFFITFATAISKSSCVTCTRRSRRANMPASVQTACHKIHMVSNAKMYACLRLGSKDNLDFRQNRKG